MNGQADNEAFARLIVSIEPWLGEVVIIGGWAHQLYRLHPSAQVLGYVPLTTEAYTRSDSRGLPFRTRASSRLDEVPVEGRLMVTSHRQGAASKYDCCTCPCPTSYNSLTASPSQSS
jgi:hypothetical protein